MKNKPFEPTHVMTLTQPDLSEVSFEVMIHGRCAYTKEDWEKGRESSWLDTYEEWAPRDTRVWSARIKKI
jgi:hypothetical protein